VHDSIRPTYVGLGFNVPAEVELVVVAKALVQVLVVFGIVGQGIPQLTSTQYELPIIIPEQSSLIAGFYIYMSVNTTSKQLGFIGKTHVIEKFLKSKNPAALEVCTRVESLTRYIPVGTI
jgi:hypothetical protein